MCDTCGCGKPGEEAVIRIPGEDQANHDEDHHLHHDQHHHSHSHHHGADHHHHSGTGHTHDQPEHGGRTVHIGTDILVANNLLAERNRGMFEAKAITAINLMSSPGSGKTTLLERTINDLKEEIRFSVIEGDQQTMNDAERIRETGVPVVQVNTGSGCHLDAEMINKAVKKLRPWDSSVVFIENVGNLVCPSLFDLGESWRVVIMSVTEGEDKPLKYPHMFRSVSLCILNKCDLLPYLDYDIKKAVEFGHQVNPQLQFMKVSAKTGEGMEEWYRWLKELVS